MLSVHAHRPAGWPHFVKSVCDPITDGQNLQVRPRVSGQPHSSVCSGLFFLFLFLLLGAPSSLLPCRDLNSCLLGPSEWFSSPIHYFQGFGQIQVSFPSSWTPAFMWDAHLVGTRSWTNTHLSMLLSMQPTVLRCGPGGAASGMDKAS